MTKTAIDKNLKYAANPRQITGDQFNLLKKHLETLGDLSGVVFCTKNKAYLGGNMRSEVKAKIIIGRAAEAKRPVWDIGKPNKSETGHSTQKPFECMARPIRNNSAEGEFVYDPFIGSGTTMVACEDLSRKSVGIEIDSNYCAVILERLSNLGLEPKLIETSLSAVAPQ